MAREVVDSRGEHGALDAWGSLADRAHSLRDENLRHLRQKAYFPKTSVPAKNFESAIALWELDVRSFQDASGETIPEGNRRMGLTDMCPEKLQEHLRACGKDRFKSYEHIKCEIVDWLMNEARKGKIGGRAAALGEKESEGATEEEAVEVDWDLDLCAADEENMSRGQLMALVKNAKMKLLKGKGKGKSGKGSPKICYECGVEGHVAADCSVRKERVAAGGPERLPSEDVQIGNGKGGKSGGKGGKGGLKGGDGKVSFGK